MIVRPATTQISLGIRPVWSESSLSAWRKLGSLATHWAHSEDSDETGRMPRLIWVFAGRTVTLLVLSWGGSFYENCKIWSFPIRRLMFAIAVLPFLVLFLIVSVIVVMNNMTDIWAASRQNQQNNMCPAKTQTNLGIRPVWSGLRCVLNG